MSDSKKVKLIGTIIGVILFCLLVAGFTYAWFTWESNKLNVSGTTSCFDFNYTEGNVVTEDLILIDANIYVTSSTITIKKGMAVTNINVGKLSTCYNIDAKLLIDLKFNTIPSVYLTGGSCVGALNYAIVSYDPNIYDEISSTALNGETFDIIKTGAITSTNTENVIEEQFVNDTMQNYLLIFYIDGNKVNNTAGDSNVNIGVNVTASQVKNTTSQSTE